MNHTTTGIAVAVAVVVVGVFFLYPSLSPFGAPSAAAPAASNTITTDQTSSTTMPDTASAPPANPNQLQITDEVVGTGAMLAPGTTVQIKYTGMLTDGTVFDSSDAHGGTPLTLLVAADGSLHTPDGGSLIQGWGQGVVGMKAGGKRRLVIPPALGYGAQAVGNVIPANSTLVFDLELVSVVPTK
jgi:FKBP-type peptidyl-prolyl cis-trans isomerase